MRPTESRLLEMALCALEEVVARCHHEPVLRSKALALVLAYVASRSRGARWPFDSFWRCVEEPRAKERWSSANSALNGIYAAGGWTRSIERISFYEHRARQARSEVDGHAGH